MRFGKWIPVAAWALVIASVTLIGRPVNSESIFRGLFWELHNNMWRDIVGNILLFIPLGFFLRKWKSLFIALTYSCLIEVLQYCFRIGYCELDDVLNNTIGAAIGILLWVGINAMVLKKWEDLPEFMQTSEVRPYWEILNNKRGQLVLKRVFDITAGSILLVISAIPMGIIAVMIKADSPGPVFYRQERVTTYGKKFKIHKFRTMVNNADKIGSAVTVGGDARITKIGAKIRNLRIDEVPQLFDVLSGNMSFVGTRPEATKYVKQYSKEMYATLLLPAGITSEASIRYKDEAKLMDAADDVDRVYVEEVLPGKMKYNLESIKKFGFIGEIATMFRTVFAVCGKEYK